MQTAFPMNATIVIEPGRSASLYWRDLWRYRELLLFLAWRNVAVLYKQTAIGVAWAVLRPVSTMLVFTLVFSKIAGLPSDGVPYPLLVFAGMLPWQLFASALNDVSGSMVNNSNLVSKVYFPRLLVPVSALAVGLTDFLISLPVLAVLMLYWQVAPTWRLVALLAFVPLALATAVGAGLWLCALNVRYRDVRHAIPFIVQFGLYLSPVGYSSTAVPESYRWLYALNPMALVIDGCRWALFGTPMSGAGSAITAIGLVAALIAGGVWYFRRTERTFADII
jgi:lipopolysaccharide transport system permease protein